MFYMHKYKTNRPAPTTLIASFDRSRPTAVNGGAWSQSPECAGCAVRNLALETASVNFEESDVSAVLILPATQFRCLAASEPVGAEVAEALTMPRS